MQILTRQQITAETGHHAFARFITKQTGQPQFHTGMTHFTALPAP